MIGQGARKLRVDSRPTLNDYGLNFPFRTTSEVKTVATTTDPIEDLQARVAFLEETLYNFAALMTGGKDLGDLPTTGKVPLSSHDQGRILTAFAEVLSGEKAPKCPPWCIIDGSGPSVRPDSWPAGEDETGA